MLGTLLSLGSGQWNWEVVGADKPGNGAERSWEQGSSANVLGCVCEESIPWNIMEHNGN